MDFGTALVGILGAFGVACLGWVAGCQRARSRLTREVAELRTERQLLSSLAEGFADGLVLLDHEDRILYANPQLADMSDFTAEELRGRPFSALLAEPAPDAPGSRLRFGPAQELEFARGDGGRSWAVAEVLSAQDSLAGRERKLVTVRLRRGAALEQARLLAVIENAAREWQLTFDTVESVLLVLDPENRIRRVNRAASVLAGRSYHEVLGLRPEEIGAEEPWQTAAELAAAVRRTGASSSAQARHAASGKTWDLAASLSVGVGDRIVVVATDISGLVRLQDSLRKSEVMSAMGSLVAGVAHEVRNPLFGISAALDAFESRFAGREEYARYIFVLRSQLQRLNLLMQQLLDYGRPHALEIVTVEVVGLVDEASTNCAPHAVRGAVTIEKRIVGALPPLALDRGRFLQVLTNLLENAIQHSASGSVVEIEVEAGSTPPGAEVHFRVSDRGPGFAAEDLPRLFEPFFTRRREGTGLGLSIVHRIVEQHGGSIEARNRPGGGAMMEVRLPLFGPDQAAERRLPR